MISKASVNNKLPLVIEVEDWVDFTNSLKSEPYNSPSYIWRGQAAATWQLKSSFDRLVEASEKGRDAVTVAAKHLRRFRSACRGRRGPNPSAFGDESEAWAMAQHNGMKTPLLDWTESPYVALFFAFEKAIENLGPRAVWCYFLPTLTRQYADVADDAGKDKRTVEGSNVAPLLAPIRPTQDDNLRLLSQAGLFTQVPLGKNFDDWVSENASLAGRVPALAKFVIPDRDRAGCLRSLNRMNVNHMSLFPDLYGAGMYCNTALAIDQYSE